MPAAPGSPVPAVRRRGPAVQPPIPGRTGPAQSFGLGHVKKFVDLGANSVITISFNSGQTKSLLLQYAELVKKE